MRLLPLAFLALAAVLLGCVSVNWENQTISANISVPEGLNNTIPVEGIIGNITASATPEIAVAPDKIKACIFGPHDAVIEGLFSDGVVFAGNAVAIDATWLTNNAKPADVEDCAIIMLNDGGEGRYLDYVPRTAIKQRISSGAGLLVSREAGTLVHDDNAVRGWEYVLAGVVPVSLPESPANLTVNATFVTVTAGGALEGTEPFNVTDLNVTDINLGNGENAALFRTGPYQTSVAYPAVVKGGSGRGLVYYVSFAPDAAPEVYKALVRFLAADYLGKNFG